jgi:uncharacterized protein (DUF2237 family)
MKNIFGNDLKSCSFNPLTGYLRDGFCRLDNSDRGTHIVCAVLTKEFLEFTRDRGNDLIAAGLKPGDRWCLCVSRWIEAYENGVAPFIDLNCTEKKVLEYIPMNVLLQYKI